MPLTRKDLQEIKGVVVEGVGEVVEPYFNAVQKDFTNVYARFDRIEGKLEDLLAMR